MRSVYTLPSWEGHCGRITIAHRVDATRRLGKKGNRYYSTLEETPCECCERLVIECFAVLGSSSRDATCGSSMEDTRSSKPSGGIPRHVLDCSRADVSRSRFEHGKASAPGSLPTHSLDSLNTMCVTHRAT